MAQIRKGEKTTSEGEGGVPVQTYAWTSLLSAFLGSHKMVWGHFSLAPSPGHFHMPSWGAGGGESNTNEYITGDENDQSCCPSCITRCGKCFINISQDGAFQSVNISQPAFNYRQGFFFFLSFSPLLHFSLVVRKSFCFVTDP